MAVLLTWEPTDVELDRMRQTWPDASSVVRMGELTPAELDGLLPEVDVMVGYMRTIPGDRLADATGLRLIHVLGHGVDGLLTPDVKTQVRERGIQVARSNPCAIPMAEFVLMAMIALTRRTVRLHNSLVERGDWSTELTARRAEGVLGGELYGATLGLVGYGNIAGEIHTRAAAFGMRVGTVVRRPDAVADSGLDFVSDWRDLDDFLGRCDYVALCIPLTDQTRHLVDAGRIAAMKQGAYLVNISRGALVDEDALYDGLASGRLAGAALDTFESEDTKGKRGYPSRRPLHEYNTLLTPHYSGATAQSRDRALATVGDNLGRLQRGEPLRNLVRLAEGF
ncbi:MAG: hypothetical protein GEV07_19605 [Streptosporangiales bacterium]|nr:hypothetical protein [Streptosporangiales bacterium]